MPSFTADPKVDTDGYRVPDVEEQSPKRWQAERNEKALYEQKLAIAQKAAGKKGVSDAKKKELKQEARREAPHNDVLGQTPAQYTQDWKQSAIDRWSQAGYGSQATALTNAGWTGQDVGQGDALDQVVAAGKANAAAGKKGNDAWEAGNDWEKKFFRALDSNGEHRFFDHPSDPKTNVSRINRSGQRESPDPFKEPFWVPGTTNGKPDYAPGTWAKIEDGDGNYIWARAMDNGGGHGVHANSASEIEASAATWSNMHNSSGVNPGYTSTSWGGVFKADGSAAGPMTITPYPGSDGGVKSTDIQPMGLDEEEASGRLLESGESKSISGPDDLIRQIGKPVDVPSKAQQQQGQLLLDGYPGPDQVLYGPDGNQVGYSNPLCQYEGGSYVDHGSQVTKIGPGLDLVARITDQTKEQKNVVSGAIDISVGGPSAKGPNC